MVIRAGVRLVDGRLTWTSRPPLVLRRTGPRRVHVVQVGGGPLGGDVLSLDVDLGPGQHLAVCSAAATVVQPGPDPAAAARLDVRCDVADGAVLAWTPEPTVVCDRADWTSDLRVALAGTARAYLSEQVVLGRSGQRGGRCRQDLRVDVDGEPLLVASTRLDGADPALTGPGGTAGERSVGSVVVAGGQDLPEGAGDGPGVRWAWSALDGPGAVLTALGSASAVRGVLDRALDRALSGAGPR